MSVYTMEDLNECKKILDNYKECFTTGDWSNNSIQTNNNSKPTYYDPLEEFNEQPSNNKKYSVETVGDGPNQKHIVKDNRTKQQMVVCVLIEVANKITELLNSGKNTYDNSIINLILKDNKFQGLIKEMKTLHSQNQTAKFQKLKTEAIELKKSI